MRKIHLIWCKFALMAAVLCWPPGLGVAQNPQPLRSIPLRDARVNLPPYIPQGAMWMNWLTDHRLGFVQGLLEGSFGNTSLDAQRPRQHHHPCINFRPGHLPDARSLGVAVEIGKRTWHA